MISSRYAYFIAGTLSRGVCIKNFAFRRLAPLNLKFSGPCKVPVTGYHYFVLRSYQLYQLFELYSYILILSTDAESSYCVKAKLA